MGLGRGAPEAVHDPGVAGTSPQEAEGDLGILHFTNRIEEFAGRCHSGRSVGSDERLLPNSCPKEFEVAEEAAAPSRSAKEAVWEVGNQLGCREIHGGHDLALVKIELEAKAAAALLHMAKGSSYCVQVACQDPIVKVEGCKAGAALELLGHGLQRDSEEQGS